MSRADALKALPLGIVLLVGIVLLTLDHSDTVLTATGLGLVAIGSIGLVSYAFYLVGRSEDEERRRARRP